MCLISVGTKEKHFMNLHNLFGEIKKSSLFPLAYMKTKWQKMLSLNQNRELQLGGQLESCGQLADRTWW